MKTDELINIISRDTPLERHLYLRRFALYLFVILALAIAAVVFSLGVRADAASLQAPGGWILKYVFVATLLLTSGAAWWRHGEPGKSPWVALSVAALTAGFVAVLAAHSLYVMGPQAIARELFVASAIYCVVVSCFIAVFSGFFLLRLAHAMAPVDMKAHGYLHAFFSSSIGVFAYSLHCNIDTPAYIAFWYIVAIVAFTTLAGPIFAKKIRW